MSKEKNKTDEKVKFIIEFITSHQNDFTRCADAHKAFMDEHGKVSYVHFNRKFRELCPHLKPKKKVRVLRPVTVTLDPIPKNQELKDKKRQINHYHQRLRDSETLLKNAIETNDDQENVNRYRDLRDVDRKAILDCYEDLISYYEEKISDDVKEIETQLHVEAIRNGEELDIMLKTNANALITESDETDEETLEGQVSSTMKSAADIISPKSKEEKLDLEPVPADFNEEEEEEMHS